MKKTLLILILALGMCSINVNAQTKRRPVRPVSTNSSRKQSAQVKKTREVGEDGFVWYKLKCGNLYGVQDLDGNIIIPIKFDKIRYVNLHTRYFEVESGDFEGVYTRKGRLIVSTDRHYTNISAGVGGEEEGKVFWKAYRNGGGCMILDAKGNEAFSAEQYSDIKLESSFGESGNSHCNKDICYFSIRKKDSRYPQYGIEGICSLDGELIFEPRTFTAYMYDNGTKIRYYDNVGDDKVISINYDGKTRFDYNTFDELINYSYDPVSWALSHSSNSNSSSSSSSTSSNGNISFIYPSYVKGLDVYEETEAKASAGTNVVSFDFNAKDNKIIVKHTKDNQVKKRVEITPSQSSVIITSEKIVISYTEHGIKKLISLMISQKVDEKHSLKNAILFHDDVNNSELSTIFGECGTMLSISRKVLGISVSYEGTDFNSKFNRVKSALEKYKWLKKL